MTKEAGTKIDNCMKVMKFGGTSVGSVNSILSVKRIVESAGEPVIVVVSALGGITRSEERRVGKECRIGCRSRWSPYH